MDYTTFTTQQCFDEACRNFGLEDPHTVAIGHLLQALYCGDMCESVASSIARIVYHDGQESLYYNDDWEEDEDYDDSYYEKPEWEDYFGFDPYMGCYTGDC